MSFGFGVGDFIAVGKLVWDLYSAYTDAPEQFRKFSPEILSLYIVIRKVEDQLGISGSDGTASGSQLPAVASWSAKDKNDLMILYDGLQAITKELEDLLKKYKSLGSSRNPIDRFKWKQEDLVGLREKIRSNVALLTAFNATLVNCQLEEQNARLIGIQEQLEKLLVIGGLRHRGSVASLHSVAPSIGQKQAWKELSRELHRNGITAEMIKAKKEEICKLFQTASVLSFRDEERVLQGPVHVPERKQEGKGGKKIDWAPFWSIMEMLSLRRILKLPTRRSAGSRQ